MVNSHTSKGRQFQGQEEDREGKKPQEFVMGNNFPVSDINNLGLVCPTAGSGHLLVIFLIWCMDSSRVSVLCVVSFIAVSNT